MSDSFFRVEMLPALHGDCLVVEYGNANRTRRLLIDGGPIGAYESLASRVALLPATDRTFELIVLSHVDTDHIDGLVKLFATPKPWPFSVQDVWFNGWQHLQHARVLGGKQGEYFSALLTRRLDAKSWNGAFGGHAIVVPDDGDLPVCQIPGGMTLTLLSPSLGKLEKMRKAWCKDIGTTMAAGDLDRGWELLSGQKRYLPTQGLLGSTPELDELLKRQSHPDAAAANGSSIAFLAELEVVGGSKSCLFLADAHPEVVCDSLRRLLKARGIPRLKVDAVKVAHHGSKGNTTDELLSLVESPRFLISTNGAQFDHPDEEAIQRIVGRSDQAIELVFNYESDRTMPWADPALQRKLRYSARYPDAAGKSVVVAL